MPALDGYIGPSRNAGEKVQSGRAEPLGTIPDCIKLIQNGCALAVCVEHITSEGAADLRLRLGARNLLRALLDYAHVAACTTSNYRRVQPSASKRP